jgi:hypothetical protein
MEDIKEKSADELFVELGYEIKESQINVFIIDEFENIAIKIHKTSKEISFYRLTISIQELKAINKKIKELRLVVAIYN